MMLSKKNSETLENFSEKLEVEGRSLWQDARRRFSCITVRRLPV